MKHEGATYFVTFRLADSLPQAVLMRFQRERAERLQRMNACHQPHGATSQEQLKEEIDLDYRRKVERFLDKGVGSCFLARPEIASVVAEALRHFHEERYVLGPWVVMPNHVHSVVWPMPNYLLSDILKNWKGYSAHEANKILGRTNAVFWQRESFDHWIRNDVERERIGRYIAYNPVKADLSKAPENWHWGSAWHEPAVS